MKIDRKEVEEIKGVIKNIRPNDPKTAEILKELYQTLHDRFNDGRLNYLEKGVFEQISFSFKDSEEVKNRQIVEVLNTIDKILNFNSDARKRIPELNVQKQIQELIYNKIFGDNNFIADELEEYAEEIIKLNYNNKLSTFSVNGLKKNVYNYFGFILQAIVDKISDSTISKKVFNIVNRSGLDQIIIVTDLNFKIRNLNDQAENTFNTTSSLQKNKSLFELIPQLGTYEQILSEEYFKLFDDFDLFIKGTQNRINGKLKFIRVDSDENEVSELVFIFDCGFCGDYQNDFAHYQNYLNADTCIKNLNALTLEIDEKKLGHIYDTLSLMHQIKNNSQNSINKIEVDKYELVNDTIDLSVMIRQILSELKIYAIKDMVVSLKIDEKITFHSNYDLLFSSIKSIILNAIQFKDLTKKSSNIEITATLDLNKIKILLKDNGIGILKQHIDRIFDKGFRVKSEKIGQGYGLFFAKRNIEFLQGQINVNSSYLDGTTFIIELPLR